MDTTLFWTAVGSAATVAGVVVTIVIYRVQVRAGRKPATQGIDADGDAYAASGNQYINIFNAAPGAMPTGAQAGAGEQAASTVLRAPTGRLPEHVRGRDELLERLTRLLASPDGRIHVLAGLGGTGKSTVGLQLADEATVLGVPAWWVPAVDAETVTGKLLELAAELGAAHGEIAQAKAGQRNPADLLWRCLSRLRTLWLLIFDNVDDPAVLTVGGADAASGAGWLRPSGVGIIVVTSRNRDALTWGRHAQLHPVDWLDPPKGGEVLTDLAPRAGTTDEAAALSARLGGIPLALRHAGSHLASEFAAPRTFADYTQALDKRFVKLMGNGRGAAPGSDHNRAVITTTWELSLDALAAADHPQARPMLRMLSCFAPAVIPSILLNPGIIAQLCEEDPDRATDGLQALSSVGLILTMRAPNGGTTGITVHPLVSETSRARLDDEDPIRITSVAIALLVAAANELKATNPADWPTWAQIAPHIRAVLARAADKVSKNDLAKLASVTVHAAAAFNWAGSYSADEELALTGLRRVTRLGPHQREVLALRFRVASARRFNGLLSEAEQEYRSLAADQRNALGNNHPDTLRTRYALSQILASRSEYKRALQEFGNVLATQNRVLGPEHPNTLDTRYEIARTLSMQDSYQEAERDYRELLTIMTRVLGPEHPNTLATRYEIARMLAMQDCYQEAERDYRELLTIMTRVLGPEHPYTLATRHEIARMLTKQDCYQEAERDYRELLTIMTRVLGPEHPNTLTTRHMQALVLAQLGRTTEAAAELRAVLAARTQVLGAKHPDTRRTQVKLDRLGSELSCVLPGHTPPRFRASSTAGARAVQQLVHRG